MGCVKKEMIVKIIVFKTDRFVTLFIRTSKKSITDFAMKNYLLNQIVLIDRLG